jgi:hypothetical protein
MVTGFATKLVECSRGARFSCDAMAVFRSLAPARLTENPAPSTLAAHFLPVAGYLATHS